MADNWKHRAATMNCRTCMWFVPKSVVQVTTLPDPSGSGSVGSKPANEAPSKLGRCRRHAPTLQGWPAVFETDWCGDHKLNEEKL